MRLEGSEPRQQVEDGHLDQRVLTGLVLQHPATHLRIQASLNHYTLTPDTPDISIPDQPLHTDTPHTSTTEQQLQYTFTPDTPDTSTTEQLHIYVWHT